MIEIIKTKLHTLILIFIVIFILIAVTDILINPSPPRVLFVDSEQETALTGKVYVNEIYAGIATEKGFDKLPDFFCLGNNDLILETEGKKYSWPTKKEDCGINFMIFRIDRGQIEVDEVTMKFFVKETEEPLSGNLYFNDRLIEQIDGQTTITKEQCKKILNINLTSSTFNAEWFHSTRWCDLYPIIEYSIHEKDLSISEFESAIDIIRQDS